MISNYYTLRYIAGRLDRILSGQTLSSVYTQEKDELVIAFQEIAPRLVISCRADASTCYLHARASRARKNTVDLLPEAVGMTLQRVTLEPGDRVMRFELSGSRTLVAQFFGNRSNVLLLDSSSLVTAAFQRGKELAGTRYEPAGRETVVDFELLRHAIAEGGASAAASIIRKTFPTFGATLTREILFRATVDPATPVGTLSESDIQRIQGAVLDVMKSIERPLPLVYTDENDAPELFSLIHLQSAAELREQEFPDIDDAIRFFLGRRRNVAGLAEQKHRIMALLRQSMEKSRRTHDAIADQGRDAARADDYEAAGTWIMGNLSSLSKGMKSIAQETAQGTAPLRLDEKLTPVQNAQRYFEKAKHARAAGTQAAARLTRIELHAQRAEALAEELGNCSTREEVKMFMTEHAEELDTFGVGEKSAERAQIPFRIFTVDGGFEVWAGKSSDNNDLLTLKYARPQDLWFHARGAGGSHVVLRVSTGKGEPGKKAREQAAGIAAYYSKMKNAKMVPVAMTEKKYVRKRKGSPPGQVVLEREKVIFAQPALPERKPDES